jgi:hypothetical protein
MAPLLCAIPAYAGISDEVFLLEAVQDGGRGALVVHFRDGQWDAAYQKFTWSLNEPESIVDSENGQTICTLRSASVTLRDHCRFNVIFEVDGGDGDTQVFMRSALLTFPELSANEAEAQATASLTLTDRNSNGAEVRGVGPPGTPMFRGEYNSGAPDGAVFTQLLGEIACDSGGTVTGTQKDPASGYRGVGAAVRSISFRFEYALTAGDRALASVSYRVTPEPTCTEDSDGDLTPDCVDDCPYDDGKIGPGACGCGVADADSDGDGTLDCEDGCPDDPNKPEPGACGCGNPDTDSDGDGIPDCIDQNADGSGEGGGEGEGGGDDPTDSGGGGSGNENSGGESGVGTGGECGDGASDGGGDGESSPEADGEDPTDVAGDTESGGDGAGQESGDGAADDASSGGDGGDGSSPPRGSSFGLCGLGVPLAMMLTMSWLAAARLVRRLRRLR